MKAEVGFITSWRKAIFFTLVGGIVVFGLVSTLASSIIGAGLVANVLSVAAFLLCAIVFVLVFTDKADHFRGPGTVDFENGKLMYEDKKHKYDISVNDIKKVDIENINMGKYNGPATAYRILIKTDKKKYYIESSRAMGRPYTEMGIYDLYLYIMENVSGGEK